MQDQPEEEPEAEDSGSEKVTKSESLPHENGHLETHTVEFPQSETPQSEEVPQTEENVVDGEEQFRLVTPESTPKKRAMNGIVSIDAAVFTKELPSIPSAPAPSTPFPLAPLRTLHSGSMHADPIMETSISNSAPRTG